MPSPLPRRRLLALFVATLAACSPETSPRDPASSAHAAAASISAGAASASAGILANTSTTGGVIYFPSAGVGLPNPTQTPVTDIPASCEAPQGAVYYEADHALVACFLASQVLVIQASTASVVATIDTTGKFDGTGTIAVSPNLQHALGASGTTLAVIQAPFDASSTITTLTLPGSVQSYQGQAVVFDPAGKAYVRTTAGITVVAPPYTEIAFSIPLAATYTPGIAITPDGSQLLAPADAFSSTVHVFTAPFSADSTSETLEVPGGMLDGIMVSPDGTCAVLADVSASAAYAIQAPFSASSTVEALPVPSDVGSFEDVAISADGQLAILSGNDSGSAPLIAIQAPCTAAGATAHSITVAGGRGAGAFRFMPPGLAPGPTLAASAPSSAGIGADVTVTLTYGNSGDGALEGTVISAPVPAGTTFSSAADGGALADDTVTWNVGTVVAGANGLAVSYVLHVTAAAGETVTISPASIKGDSGGIVFASPITLEVTAPVCGNGVVEEGETCDDANASGGDGCSASCEAEPTFTARSRSGCNSGSGGADGTLALLPLALAGMRSLRGRRRRD
jgi:cysteine-rich repeat protein